MITRALMVLLILVASPGTSLADRKADIDELVELMQLTRTIEIIRAEGQGYGEAIAKDMLTGISAESWNATVADIYDTKWMLDLVREEFDAELSQTDLAPLLRYYRSDVGREIVRLEITARRAFSNADVEAAARQHLDALIEEQADIYKQVQILINDSNLIDLNVAGTLNSSLMFYTGVYEGLDLQASAGVSEGEMLANLWAQEEEVRAESALWLNSYMVMAYQPLLSEKVEAYAAFFRSNEGRDLNRAIFAGFGQMFEQISYKLGLAVASHMSSEPL